jgi:RIP metalloprotease RseP
MHHEVPIVTAIQILLQLGADVARSDVTGLFQFAALININLAIVNLLPLPALDGGYLALLLVEGLRGGKKLPDGLEQRIMASGLLLLLTLGVFLTVKDTLNLDFIKDLLGV